MEQYIKKSALIAELKKRIRDYWSDSENTMGIYPYALEEVIKITDTLEVKEVDLKKEIDDFMAKEWEGVEEKDEPLYSMIKNDLTDVATHFFELGLGVAQKGE